MQVKQNVVLDARQRAKRAFDENAVALGGVDFTAAERRLDEAVISSASHALDQNAADRSAKAVSRARSATDFARRRQFFGDRPQFSSDRRRVFPRRCWRSSRRAGSISNHRGPATVPFVSNRKLLIDNTTLLRAARVNGPPMIVEQKIRESYRDWSASLAHRDLVGNAPATAEETVPRTAWAAHRNTGTIARILIEASKQ